MEFFEFLPARFATCLKPPNRNKITVKCLIHARNNVTRVRVKLKTMRSGSSYKDNFALSVTLLASTSSFSKSKLLLQSNSGKEMVILQHYFECCTFILSFCKKQLYNSFIVWQGSIVRISIILSTAATHLLKEVFRQTSPNSTIQ